MFIGNILLMQFQKKKKSFLISDISNLSPFLKSYYRNILTLIL